MKTEYTLSIAKTNIYAIIMLLPIAVILGTPFFIIHGLELNILKDFSLIKLFGGVLAVMAIFLLGIVAHELLHGIGWIFFTKGKFKAISFGIKWEYLTPYCHCSEPLRKWQFVIGAALPGFVLGILPAIISYFNGSFSWWFFGFFFTASAGGDIIALWMLRKVPKGVLIQDHPSELGFLVGEG